MSTNVIVNSREKFFQEIEAPVNVTDGIDCHACR